MNKPLTKQEWLAYLEKTWDAAYKEAWKAEKQDQKTPLKVLNLTVFTENRLRNGRVYDVETLQAMTSRDILAIPDMGKKALKEVLEALNAYAVNTSAERVDETAKGEHEPYPEGEVVGPCICGSWPGGKCLKCKRIEPPKREHEPVAWIRNKAMWCTGELLLRSIGAETEIPLYTAPPKREWVGLTDKEIFLCNEYPVDECCEASIRRAEAKLKEKNT